MTHMNMTPAHSAAVEAENNRKIKKTLYLLLAWLALGVAVLVCVFIWRDPTSMDTSRELPAQVIATAITIVFGGIFLLLWGLKLSPCLAYRRYLRDLRTGLSHLEEGVVVRFAEDVSFRDGLDFYQLVINVGDLKEEKDERYFYWDASLEKPQLREGQRVRAHVHGNELIGLEQV